MAAMVPLLAACHFGKKEPPTVTFHVRNDLVPAVAVTISVIPAVGARRTVGVVRASTSADLRIPVGSDADPHRLLAESGSGPAIVSRQFTLSGADMVEWTVGQNILNVSERR